MVGVIRFQVQEGIMSSISLTAMYGYLTTFCALHKTPI